MKSILVSLLSLAVWSVTGESDVTGKHETVEAKVRDDIVLPCYKEPTYDLKAVRVEWTHKEKEVHLYRKGKDDLEHQDRNFTGRTSLFHEQMAAGNISLRLSQVDDRDVGNYICLVKVKDSPEVRQCDILLSIVPVPEPEPEPEREREREPEPEPEAGKGHINYAYFLIAIPVIGITVAVYLIQRRCKTTSKLQISLHFFFPI
uniref:V-set domain containing T-cell activation inhibitor 1-like isoform X1 n=1 Tax=Epinephelus lanceolatus TaxID=310571 RepID=UPI001447634C|nr:V-set domain containing T-cell activation inhibitor 1-like isoform X1 [Epinephelus lanceolatus]